MNHSLLWLEAHLDDLACRPRTPGNQEKMVRTIHRIHQRREEIRALASEIRWLRALDAQA